MNFDSLNVAFRQLRDFDQQLACFHRREVKEPDQWAIGRAISQIFQFHQAIP